MKEKISRITKKLIIDFKGYPIYNIYMTEIKF